MNDASTETGDKGLVVAATAIATRRRPGVDLAGRAGGESGRPPGGNNTMTSPTPGMRQALPPTRLRQREVLDAQLTQCRRVDNSFTRGAVAFTRGAVAALHWLTEGGGRTAVRRPRNVHHLPGERSRTGSGRGHHLRATLHRARVRPRRGARSVVGGERHIRAARPRLQPTRRSGMRNGTRATAVTGGDPTRGRQTTTARAGQSSATRCSPGPFVRELMSARASRGGDCGRLKGRDRARTSRQLA
jgi:hypothetical protein